MHITVAEECCKPLGKKLKNNQPISFHLYDAQVIHHLTFFVLTIFLDGLLNGGCFSGCKDKHRNSPTKFRTTQNYKQEKIFIFVYY